MKSFTIAAFVALASVATAQLEDIPGCALSCFLTSLGADGCTTLTDFACHCKSADKLFASVIPCVKGACSADDQAAAIAATEKTCAAAGVPIVVPGASSAAPSSAAPATSAAPASSEAPVSSEAPASSAAPTVQTSEPAPVSSAAPVSSVSAVPTPSGNGTSPTSVAPTASQFTGAAAHATQAAGIIGAAALAFFAL